MSFTNYISSVWSRVSFWWKSPKEAVHPAAPKSTQPDFYGPPAPVEGIGNAQSINEVLDTLPEYFDTLRVLRKADEDAYAIFSRIGGTFALKSSLFAGEVRQRWIDSPPTIRCSFIRDFVANGEKQLVPLVYMMRLAGGQVCVGRDGAMANLPSGICYRVVMVYILDEQPVGETFFVHISTAGKVSLIAERRISYQKLPRGGGFYRPEIAQSKFLKRVAADHGHTVDELVQHIVATTLSCERPKSAILVRAIHGNMTAAWTIDKNDAKRFFAKRETGDASDGRRKRVLHYVGDFSRTVGDTIQNVRAHYRGERSFDWNGYHVEISGLGFHHADYFDADIEGYEADWITNRQTVSMEQVSSMLREHYTKPVFLSRKKVTA